MKNKFLCLHGHFYQPPRENPWTEEVEEESSAFPFHDWNERILHECYGPNSASTLLDAEERVEECLNNYRHLSFNFGPTLLRWMEVRHPRTYRAVLAADAESLAARGHGNALAQAYNHVILPLAALREKRTQMRWGVADFCARFKRSPEGMWLPETAVDEETLEVLLSEGLRLTILSPTQAAAVRPIGSAETDWKEVRGEGLDTTRPYRWFSRAQPGKFLDIFFYHRGLSRAVAFERLLSRGEEFLAKTLEAYSANEAVELVTLAADGETFGHHHRFGNMAVSYAIREASRHGLAALCNPAQFLEMFPPPQEVRILPKTAWSCSHGVGRWQEDCGCRVHARWHQKWRRPLRDALDWLAAELDGLFEERAREFLKDPWSARDEYVQVVLHPSPADTQRFLNRSSRKHLTGTECVAALRLLEMERHRMLMFTSCGWFFDEISGIEPVQVLKYAARAMDLARDFGPDLEPQFLERLALCPSNLETLQDGRGVFRKLVAPLRADFKTMAARHGILELLEGTGPDLSAHGFETQAARTFRDQRQEASGVERLYLAELALRHLPTLERRTAFVSVLHRGGTDVEGWVRLDPEGPWREAALEELKGAFRKGSALELFQAHRRLFEEEPCTLDLLAPEDRHRLLKLLLSRERPEKKDVLEKWLVAAARFRQGVGDLQEAERLLKEAGDAALPPQNLPAVEAVRRAWVEAFSHHLSRKEWTEALRLVERAARLGLELPVWELQGLFWAEVPSWRDVPSAAAPLCGTDVLGDAALTPPLAALARRLSFAERRGRQEPARQKVGGT